MHQSIAEGEKGLREDNFKKHKFCNDLKSFMLSMVGNVLEFPDHKCSERKN